MPRVNIYIRNEDQEKWNSIPNKPEWLHEHLNNQEDIVVNGIDTDYKPPLHPTDKIVFEPLKVCKEHGLPNCYFKHKKTS